MLNAHIQKMEQEMHQQNDRFQREKEAAELERKRLQSELGHLRQASVQN